MLPTLLFVASLFAMACAPEHSAEKERTISDQQLQQLEILEGYFPIVPDSIAALYRRYDPVTFHTAFAAELAETGRLVDSLNANLPFRLRIDTLAIDHSFEGISEAGRSGRALYISSSYFYLYHDMKVLRSVVFHEFGHLYYTVLDRSEINEISNLWLDLQRTAAFYLFHDGEYSHNSRFGGHPEDSPAELFASAFNLLQNNSQSVAIRSWLLPESQRTIVDRLSAIVSKAAGRSAPGAKPAE
jgi:hypothetical protein